MECMDEIQNGKRIGDLVLVMKRYCTECDEIEEVYQKEDLIVASQG